MTPLTLQRLAEIEAAAEEFRRATVECYLDENKWMDTQIHARYHAACNPKTVLAIVRIARAAVEWERMAVSPSEWDNFEEAELALSEALRAVGLLDDKP